MASSTANSTSPSSLPMPRDTSRACCRPAFRKPKWTRLATNTALGIRLGAGKPLVHGRDIPIGTVDADVTGVEIIRYTAPIVLIRVVDEAGKAVPGAKVAGIYESDAADQLRQPVAGLPTSVYFEKQPGGVFRSSQLLPDEKTKFVASAPGYADAHETLTLPEGATHDLTLVLKRSAAAPGDAATPVDPGSADGK